MRLWCTSAVAVALPLTQVSLPLPREPWWYLSPICRAQVTAFPYPWVPKKVPSRVRSRCSTLCSRAVDVTWLVSKPLSVASSLVLWVLWMLALACSAGLGALLLLFWTDALPLLQLLSSLM